MEIELSVGDIVVDQVTLQVGLLIERVLLTNLPEDSPISIWAWEIYWIGKDIENEKRLITWTEFGLLNVISAGTFVHYKNI
tara:strand:- start:355 stop:597 length:243 start_codon:yes stop_codon:yes gene_type:complete